MNKNHSAQQGAVAIIVVLIIFGLIGIIGLGIDVGYAYVQKNRLQNVADATALACVISPTSAPCPIGSHSGLYAELNPLAFEVETVNPGNNSLCPIPLDQRDCAQATAKMTWSPFFIGMFGVPTLSTEAVAIAGKIASQQGCLITPSYFSVSGSQGVTGTNCANYFGSVSSNGNPRIEGTANYVFNDNLPSSCPTCQPPAISRGQPLLPPTLTSVPVVPTNAGTHTGFIGTPDTTLVCPSKTTCTLSPGLYNSLDCSASQAVCQLIPTSGAPAGFTFAFNGDVQGPSSNGTMSGHLVLIIMNGVGRTLSLSGGGSLSLSSPVPPSGGCSSSITPESQMVIYSDNTGVLSYNGNVASMITGNIYMPNYAFALGGNGGLSVQGSVVVNGYSDAGGGNRGLVVDGTNTCGFTVGGGKVILVN